MMYKTDRRMPRELRALAGKNTRVQRYIDELSRDRVTGLPTRGSYESKLVETVREVKGPVAVVYMDLDGFKGVNDTYGHSAGDDILREFASVLKRSFRDSDYVARVGGDEFAAILPYGDENFTVQNLRDRIARGMRAYGGCMSEIGVSCGVNALDTAYADIMHLIPERIAIFLNDGAESAMRKAKKTKEPEQPLVVTVFNKDYVPLAA